MSRNLPQEQTVRQTIISARPIVFPNRVFSCSGGKSHHCSLGEKLLCRKRPSFFASESFSKTTERASLINFLNEAVSYTFLAGYFCERPRTPISIGGASKSDSSRLARRATK